MTLEGPIHFVGIGGSGMAPLAGYLKSKGFKVQGSDLSLKDATCDYFNSIEIPFFKSHSSSNIEKAATLIYSTAIPDHNEEMIAAKNKNLPIMHRSELLNSIGQSFDKFITVCGSHGKSTTTALTSYLLHQLNYHPVTIMGSQFVRDLQPQSDGNHWNTPDKPKIVIAEADESDGSFLHYKPYISIVTNIDNDHLDFYKTEDNLRQAFKQHILAIDPNGSLIYNADHESSRKLSRYAQCSTLSFGFGEQSQIRCDHTFERRTHTVAQISYLGESYVFEFPFFGTFNLSNALAAIACAIKLGIPFKDLTTAFKNWPGIKRRQELIVNSDRFVVINDYAHNPQKIKSLLDSVRKNWKSSQVVCVFEPHRYSRVESLYQDFIGAFQSCDLVLLMDLYSAGEKNSDKYNKQQFRKDIADHSKTEVLEVSNTQDIYDIIASKANNNKTSMVIPVVGAGHSEKTAFEIGSYLCANELRNIKESSNINE